MRLLSNLFRKEPDPREAYRPLWRAIVITARDPFWYREGGVVDAREGRFDMVTAVLALAMVRMERGKKLAYEAAYLTELFVEDMEGQLRQEGIGDPTVGKQIGKMMGALGGRITAYRAGTIDQSKMEQAAERNITMSGSGTARQVAEKLMALFETFANIPDDLFLSGDFGGADAR